MRISTNHYQQISLNALLEQQAKLSHVQQQIASGRRILSPSDDPAGAARALELAKAIDTIERYGRNADYAESRLRLEGSVIAQVEDSVLRIRDLTVQANNATVTAEDRQKIGAEVRERLQQIIQFANTTDGGGEYLFAGFKSRTEPFMQVGDTVSYRGDQSARMVQVGPNRQLATTHSGFDVFVKIPTGDGRYMAGADGANNGTGVTSAVQVTDASAAASASVPYEIVFSENAGQLSYDVTDAAGNTVVSNEAFESGDTIAVSGLSITIDGEPAVGDRFTIAESGYQSLFKTVDKLVDALERATDTAAGRAEFLNIGNRTLTDLDQALNHLLERRAELGGRLNALDSEREANEAAVLELKKAKSGIEDLNYAQAVTELKQRLVGLKAAQQSYAKVQGLSLFNYL
ncbi:MAG: flagellar hook-associated protein FlgL [Nitrococcus sp.]|nr:flagellar hook-associated protein FlgL [Nitrococcus sp.]